VTTDTSIRWRWNGTEWKNIGTVQNIGIASNTTPGTVKGGGNVTIAADGLMNVDLSAKLDKTGDAKDNIATFMDSTADAALTSGSKLSVLIGLIKYKLSNLLTLIGNLANLTTSTKASLVAAINELVSGKIDKTSIATTDTVNDTTKVLGANVGYTHGQEIDAIQSNYNRLYKSASSASTTGIPYSELKGSVSQQWLKVYIQTQSTNFNTYSEYIVYADRIITALHEGVDTVAPRLTYNSTSGNFELKLNTYTGTQTVGMLVVGIV
jgi:hypothetical protein